MRTEIVINPKIRFGKPIIKGTRITIEEIIGALAGGMDFEEIQKEYGLSKAQISAALNYVSGWLKGEEIRSYEVLA
jgi:uncharacterized protein (DUF433 family)